MQEQTVAGMKSSNHDKILLAAGKPELSCSTFDHRCSTAPNSEQIVACMVIDHILLAAVKPELTEAHRLPLINSSSDHSTVALITFF
jgi:hypothetical protein